jgi:hypothetical protein
VTHRDSLSRVVAVVVAIENIHIRDSLFSESFEYAQAHVCICVCGGGGGLLVCVYMCVSTCVCVLVSVFRGACAFSVHDITKKKNVEPLLGVTLYCFKHVCIIVLAEERRRRRKNWIAADLGAFDAPRQMDFSLAK